MDKHDEIHGFPNGGNNVGVTPGTLIVSAIEADARAQQGASGGSGLGQAGMSSGGLSSFSLYWDVATKAWKCHEPLVLKPDGTAVSVQEPQNGYGNGTYYLHVEKNYATNAYTAEIKAGGSTGSSDEIAVIRLFTIADTEEGTVQYHTGVYSIRSDDNPFIPGDDTFIKFTPVTSGANKGKIKVDVYYI